LNAEKINSASGDCAEFQDRLPELLGENQDPRNDAHLASCENCKELVSDLMYIAQQAKLLLPLHDPSPEVWNKIEAGIKTAPKS
jgi:hypothetical protein